MTKEFRSKVRLALFAEYNKIFSRNTLGTEELRRMISKVADEVIRTERISLSGQERDAVIDELLNELTGFGPLEELLKDPKITEIMINGIDKVFIEKEGRTELARVTFDDENQLMVIVQKILRDTRRRVDESFPYTEVSLKDGSRVNIIIPPLALNGPTLTIRKFLKEIRLVEDLINLATLDKRMADFLVACIKAKINIIFSGATGAGKTTTLNVLSSYIPADERVITIEDTAELRLSQEHVVRLECRQPNIEGKGEVTIRSLFKNSLRMRPDRIILGEIRGGEALDMLQAICSGHKGSLSVLHANSPQDVIYRLETMILTSGIPIGMEAIHRQIITSINIIVQQEQVFDGSRKITHITQLNGLKDDQIILEDIFFYDIENVDPQGKVIGKWKAAGVIPAFHPLFKKSGITLPETLFNKD